MIRKFILPLLVPVLLVSSCKPKVAEIESDLGIVKEISGNTGNRYRRLMSENRVSPSGCICLVGQEDILRRISMGLRRFDSRDNASGSFGADGLPDFAGETIVSIIDTVNVPYSMPSGQNAHALREMTVCQAMLAVDTLSHISPYDFKGLGEKKSSKIIVLADPYPACFGSDDVRGLFSYFGYGVPVMSSLEIMLKEIFKEMPSANVGILCDGRYEGSGIYEESFRKYRDEYGAEGAECFVLSLDDRNAVLRNFLDRYQEAGNSRPLDVLVVEDMRLDADNVKAEVAGLVSLLSQDSVKYGNLLSARFHIKDAISSIASESYDYLRTANLFSHKISLPVCEYYFAVPSLSENDEGAYILIQDNYVQN